MVRAFIYLLPMLYAIVKRIQRIRRWQCGVLLYHKHNTHVRFSIENNKMYTAGNIKTFSKPTYRTRYIMLYVDRGWKCTSNRRRRELLNNYFSSSSTIEFKS